MRNIAIIGQIQQELQKFQLVKLIEEIKKDAGNDCHIFCNASGMFSWVPQIEKHTSMLFENGIDIMFLGEQAISRTAGRNIIGKNDFTIIRPVNLSKKAPGYGIKKVNLLGDEMWLLCVSDCSGKVPANPPAFDIVNFFKNKDDSLPVLININGTNFRYKEALFWKVSELSDNVVIFGNGSGLKIEAEDSDSLKDMRKNIYIPDVGAVVTQGSIEGMPPELWWKRNVMKIPQNADTMFGILKCDYCVVFSDEIEKNQKILHKTIKI